MFWPFSAITGQVVNKQKYHNGYLCLIDIQMVRKFKTHSVMCIVIVIV